MPRIPLPDELDAAFALHEGEHAGLTRKRMRGRDLSVPFRGVRVRADAPMADHLDMVRSYRPRLRPSDVYSHTTAALVWDVPLPRPLETDARIHVSGMAGSTRPRIPGVTGHELSDTRIRRCIRRGLPITDAATTWTQLAASLGFRDLVAAGDHLVLVPREQVPGDTRPHVTREELAARLERCRGSGLKRAHLALAAIREGAESRRETFLRLDLLAAGLPEPVLQSRIDDERNILIGYGDLVYPELGVLVEYDGQQHRTDSEQYHRDIVRHDRLIANDWLRIRVDKHTPRCGPDSAPARTRAALLQRGWRPATSLIRQVRPL